MSVKSGKIITTAAGFLLDRLQSVGPSNLNIPTEKIHETGNELAVATIRDTPDLSFDMESYDVTCEAEAILLGLDPTALSAGQVLNFAKAVPLEVVSPVKGAGASKASIRGAVVPHLTLENVRYQFGVGQNSTQSYTLRGDSVYYVPGTPYFQEFSGTGGTGAYSFTHTAIKTVEKGADLYALGVTVIYADGTYKRLILNEDFTNTSGGVTMIDGATAPVGSRVRVSYGAITPANFPQTVHPVPTVKPAAVKGKDIDFYVAVQTGVGQELVKWRGVQSVEISRQVQLEHDDELGNPHHVSSDYDTPEVSGTVTMRANSIEYLFERLAQVTNTPADQVANLLTSQPLEIQARVRHPETGVVLKTIRIPDARFEPAPLNARVEQRIESQFPFSSDSGLIDIINGVPLTDEVQSLEITGNPTGGTFTITFDSQTTGALDHDATAAEVELEIASLSNVGPGNVNVTSALTNESVSLTVGGSGLTDFTLTYGAQTTVSLDDNASAADVQDALEDLPSIGAGNVTVTGDAGGPWTVTFVGALAGTNATAITTTPTGGTGTVTPVVTQVGGNLKYTVTFIGDLSGANQPAMTTTESFSGGSAPDITVTTVTEGGA